MTGLEFWQYLQQKIDKDYSSYLDNTKAQALIKESMYKIVDQMYHRLSFEKEADEMVAFMVTEYSVTPASGLCTLNKAKTSPVVVSEIPFYMHMMRILATYRDTLVVTGSGTLLSSVNHKLRKGSTVINGATTYTVIFVDGNNFKAVDSGGNLATAVGTYFFAYDIELKPMSSSRKAGSFHKANIVTPRYEFLNDGTSKNRSVKISPTPYAAKVDYFRVPPYDIDITNNAVLLTDYYSQKFLYSLLDECVLNFGAQTKDYQTKQSAQQDIIQNP